jgi:hypothetical protein
MRVVISPLRLLMTDQSRSWGVCGCEVVGDHYVKSRPSLRSVAS